MASRLASKSRQMFFWYVPAGGGGGGWIRTGIAGSRQHQSKGLFPLNHTHNILAAEVLKTDFKKSKGKKKGVSKQLLWAARTDSRVSDGGQTCPREELAPRECALFSPLCTSWGPSADYSVLFDQSNSLTRPLWSTDTSPTLDPDIHIRPKSGDLQPQS